MNQWREVDKFHGRYLINATLDGVIYSCKRRASVESSIRRDMKAVALLVLATVTCWCVPPSDGANILAIFAAESRSHWIVFREMLVELGRRGHHLTVLAPFEEQHENWELLKMADPQMDHRRINFLVFEKIPTILQLMFLFYMSVGQCRKIMEDAAVQTLLQSQDRKFDLIIFETFVQDCLLGFAHKFKVPVVAASPIAGGSSWINDMIGNPYPLAYVPETALPYTGNMNLFQRANNVLTASVYRFCRRFFYLPSMDEIAREHFKDPAIPALADLERNTSLVLSISHFSFHHVKPMLPNMVEVAGMHIKPSKKLPQDLQTFMDTAKDGVIYFSLGSNVRSVDLPEDYRNIFFSVFSKLKTKVLWKFEVDSFPNMPANVKIGKWFPQSDILAHKNLKFFMTHGGMMSLQESLYNGVPLLGFPIFGDQTPNLLKGQENGYAIMLKFSNLTEESLGWAVNEMLTNPSYMENAKKYSRLFHDRPEKPLDTAVNAVEYVVRHGGARHMRSAALDLAWYQYLLLDVLLFVLACAAAAVAAAVVTAKAIAGVISRSGSAFSKEKGSKRD
ncbi:UDP-glucosyltransferase 2-like [Schistocerca serialis cubense]|uniref:UDP-glucosyltransferase 2-like n=1 Tax=Schistocerca serialis cubense TaxID=2023355 RepID=UPI00214F3CAD|nr:UDP-glucosyltransferase 2-like [Schistocerca serialis cubense]